jgi:flagellar hook assembly protein FlgD
VTSVAGGSPVFRVHTDAGVEGWMTGSALRPRDSAAPRVWDAEDGTGAFSPDGDGSRDSYQVSIRLSEPSSWTLRIEDDGGRERASASGSGDTAALTWAPDAGSMPDGSYRWRLEAEDGWGNGPLQANGTFVLDTRAPDVSVSGSASGAAPVFSPNGDGYRDTFGFTVGSSEPGSVIGTVRDASDAKVDSLAIAVGSGTATLAWDGRNGNGAVVSDGLYTITFAAEDEAGNRSQPQARPVAVYGALSQVRVSKTLFFPQDGDSLASKVTFAFNLARVTTVTWTVVNAAGTQVRTIMADQSLAAGAHSWAWDGRNDAGAYVPRGAYTTVVRAADGDLVTTQRVSVRADAFRITPSDTTPARRQRITVTITSAEGLKAAPRLAVYQPGIGAWTVATRKVATGVYRVTITLKASSKGTLRLKAYGKDSGGRSQYSNLSIPLH